MRLCLIWLTSCVTLSTVPPAGDVTVIAVSSGKDVALAESVARSRATARAGQIKQGLAFVLDRSRGKPMLKLVGESASAGVIPTVEPRKPRGMRAQIALQRTPQEIAALSRLKVTRVKTEASGLDLAVAHDRADRTLYKDAILTFAAAEGRRDAVLSGRLTIVNYKAEDAPGSVRVQADIHVTFGSVDAAAPAPAQETGSNEELEEVEPPEEQR